MAVETIVVVGMVVVMLIAAAIMLSSLPKGPLGQETPTTLATRGAYILPILGKNIVGYHFAWAGDRFTADASGGGKGFGGGSGAVNHYESGWHILGLGPGHRLISIVQNGTVIWDGPISRTSTPSGTSFEIPGEGSFTIWWGEVDQPINTVLGDASRIGINSRWPYLWSIFWTAKNKGGSDTWPDLKYIVEGDCYGTSLVDSAIRLDDSTSKGLNPAHVLFMLTNGKFPHGPGIANSKLDEDGFEDSGVLFESEHLPLNMTIEQGMTYERLIGGILQDLGVMMPQVNGRLKLVPMRAPSGTLPTLDDDVIQPPDLERAIDRGDDPVNRMMFTFSNEATNWRQADIAFDDDGEASELGQVTSQEFPIIIATHVSVASKIARRRAQETSLQAAVRLRALRGARQLTPGQAFIRTGVGTLRVLSTKRVDDAPGVELECVVDHYGIPDIADTGTSGIVPAAPKTAQADIAFTFFELPPDLSATPSIVVLRTRAHDQISGAFLHLSADGVTYSQTGTQDVAAAGGLLLESLAESTTDVVDSGPTFEASNTDAARVLDLSTGTEQWQSGRQICTINNEIFYLQYIELIAESDWAASTAYVADDVVIPTGAPTGLRYICTTGGTSGATEPTWPTTVGTTVASGTAVFTAHHFRYRLRNLIRARLGSSKALHNINDRVYIAPKEYLSIITSPLLQAGTTLYVKTQPHTATQAVDIATVTAVSKVLTGGGTEADYRLTSTGSYRVTRTGDRRVYTP